MPILRNARHERFCQAVVGGQSVEKAYESAGFKPNRGNAGTLRRRQYIQTRIDELFASIEAAQKREVRKASDQAAISRADVMKMLAAEHQAAHDAAQFGPAVRAIELLGKELGMFIDRREQRNVDEFETLEDRELRRLVAERAAEWVDKETRH